MDERRVAMVALACLVEPGTSGIAERIAEYGPAAVLAQLTGSAAMGGGRADGVRDRRGRAGSSRAGDVAGGVAGRCHPDEVPAMLTEMARRAVRVVVPGDPEFPTQLLDLPEPPLALWVRGHLDLRATALRSVAVVGARASTAYGERVTSDLAAGLAATDWAVISGGAFGIDAAAHRAALGVGGPTIAVLACGVDVAYPRAHDSLLCRIGDAGLLVSELPPGSAPLRHRFLARNRVIAALSRGTVVVEAALRSGAIATANRAMELARPVLAVPGPVTSMASAGTNRLLHEQAARAVSTSDEVVSVILEAAGPAQRGGSGGGGPEADPDPAGREAAHRTPDRGAARGDEPDPVRSAEGLSPSAALVLGCLPGAGGRDIRDISRHAGIPELDCLAQLGLLEVVGLAVRAPRGWRRSR